MHKDGLLCSEAILWHRLWKSDCMFAMHACATMMTGPEEGCAGKEAGVSGTGIPETVSR